MTARVNNESVAKGRPNPMLCALPKEKICVSPTRTVGRALAIWALALGAASRCLAQADPASEPAVLAVSKVLPAVVNINTERVVRRTVRDP
ncbi:MAG: hypothetical protein IRY93_03980, partial [Chthoniobacterales bacterium]|nr:hypothetical protein [Chthoniobacterales bacterium]